MNKLATAVELRFDIRNAPAIDPDIKDRLAAMGFRLDERATQALALALHASVSELDRRRALRTTLEALQRDQRRPVRRRVRLGVDAAVVAPEEFLLLEPVAIERCVRVRVGQLQVRRRVLPAELAEELGKLIFEIKVLNTSVVYFREMAERLVKSECSGPH